MALAEHSMVRLRRDLSADDGLRLPIGTEAAIVHIGRDESGEAVGYIVEAFIKNEALEAGGTWHLAGAEPSDIEPVGLVDSSTTK